MQPHVRPHLFINEQDVTREPHRCYIQNCLALWLGFHLPIDLARFKHRLVKDVGDGQSEC